MHLKDDIIQKYLDDELSSQEKDSLEKHLHTCESCEQFVIEVRKRNKFIYENLEILNPTIQQIPHANKQRFQNSLNNKFLRRNPFRAHIPRPAWSAVLIIAVLILSLSFPSIRAAASQLLQIFRVEQMTAFPMDTLSLATFDTNPTLLETISQVFSESVIITTGDSNSRETISTYQQADQITTYDIRYPDWEFIPSNIMVDHGYAFEFIVDQQRIQETIDALGRQDLVLPNELDQALIQVEMPSIITAAYGSCWDPETGKSNSIWKWDEDCLVFYQSPSPEVKSPANVNPAFLAEIGMQVLGVNEAEAAAFSQASNWTTTLVLPIPRNDATHEEVLVDGTQGLLLHFIRDGHEDDPLGFALVWFKENIGYSIIGFQNEDLAFSLANALIE
ncbi:MAG: zf-HC2 domain-containing protein [Anaerolineaceae bacterium]|nr:zf-HC2 domain-containing protein [Anaerolineaceae bacterium]